MVGVFQHRGHPLANEEERQGMAIALQLPCPINPSTSLLNGHVAPNHRMHQSMAITLDMENVVALSSQLNQTIQTTRVLPFENGAFELFPPKRLISHFLYQRRP
jgi:hypothetical protein